MSRKLRIVLATALAVGATMIGTLSPGVAQAGPALPDLNVTVSVNAPDALALLAELTPEFYPAGSDDPNTSCMMQSMDESPDGLFGNFNYGCPDVVAGTYQIGIDGAPPNAIISAFCNDPSSQNGDERIEGDNTTFTFVDGQSVYCNIDVDVPAVFIDKVVLGDGPASVGDFDLEVYEDPDDLGGPDAGALVASATDPSPASCFNPLNLADCAVVLLDAGSYQLGEIPAPGYLATNVYCIPVFSQLEGERFPGTAGTFSLGSDEGESLFVYCEIENTYFTGDIVVDKVVVNDNGGTATADDFTAEVFLESDGSLAVSEQCSADGSCIDDSLPIGEYRVGETGPSGYTASVECEVTVEPDPPGIGTTPPSVPEQEREALPGDAALFELEPFGQVTCTITNNDNPVPTTTTTTTTTVAPTTTDQAQAPILPATGGDSDSLGLIAALGAAMLLMGGALLTARRRS